MSEAVVRLARTLIDIPSVTGDEGAVARHLLELLPNLGFPEVELQRVDGDRYNVHAFPPTCRIVFCTHLDTVGPFEPSREEGDRLFGRGATDAKGAMAAMILAAQDLRRRGEGGVGLLFVVGEEVDSVGAHAANRIAPACEFLVLGEPTGGRLASAHKGVLAFRLEASGRPGHSARPEGGRSAVHGLLDTLAPIRAGDWGDDPELGPATVNIGVLHGGSAANVLAAEANAEVMIRLVGSASDAADRVRELVGQNPAVEITAMRAADPTRFHTLSGFEAEPVGFGSDAPYLPAFGAPLLYGPGSIHQAHIAGEWIRKSDLHRAVEDYTRIAVALLAGEDAG